jgi:hypothetical protein
MHFDGAEIITGSTTSGPTTMTATQASFHAERSAPLWPLVLALLLACLWTWRRHFRARDPLSCVACGYSRRGLAADAKCPECGTVPSK